jgi:hypothetical protein
VNPIRPVLLLALAAMSFGACHQRSAPPPSPVAEPAAPPPAPAPPAPPTPGAPLSLPERLAREAAARPAGVLKVEVAAAALSAAGVPVGPLKQVLARPVGARYCALGRTGAGLVVSLCEFDDDTQAARGVDLSRRTFDRLIPGRRLAHRRGTLLTLTLGAPDPRRAAEGARAEAAFAAL